MTGLLAMTLQHGPSTSVAFHTAGALSGAQRLLLRALRDHPSDCNILRASLDRSNDHGPKPTSSDGAGCCVCSPLSGHSLRPTALDLNLSVCGGKPLAILVDNGTEYVSARLQNWAENAGIDLIYIQPGKPQQNVYVERYNRTVRTE